jgi:hypothetical protein
MSAHEELWETLEILDHITTSQRAGCGYRPADGKAVFAVTFLSQEYAAAPAGRTVMRAGSSEEPAGPEESLFILTYLVHAKEVPPSGTWVSGQSLPGGAFFYRGIHALPADRLAKAFGSDPSRLTDLAPFFSGKPGSYGDGSVEFLLFPRIPLIFVVWGEDEEFEARASILFDSTAASHMALDALGGAVSFAVEAFIRATPGRATPGRAG